jgi:hypothetical protein
MCVIGIHRYPIRIRVSGCIRYGYVSFLKYPCNVAGEYTTIHPLACTAALSLAHCRHGLLLTALVRLADLCSGRGQSGHASASLEAPEAEGTPRHRLLHEGGRTPFGGSQALESELDAPLRHPWRR